MKHITLVAGARPNFMKIAPIIHAIQGAKSNGCNIGYSLVHTGQHYDEDMSGKFFSELDIPEPTINLQVGSGTQAQQAANIMVGFEKYLQNNPTDIVIVVGDVTSTMACSIVAQKLHIKVAHVEAGIRSNDWTMPEEINRLVTDAISNYYFTTSETANTNLRQSGVSDDVIFFVGNTMIDTLIKQRPYFKKPAIWDKCKLVEKDYIILTLHRPSNVDNRGNLEAVLNQVVKNSNNLPIIFPAHPRTLNTLNQLEMFYENLYIISPLSYLEFNYLVERAKAVITDSGGITEETTIMNIPCITLRDTTERPETVTLGTNELVGTDPKALQYVMNKVFTDTWKKGTIPEKWDGKAAKRIIDIITNL